MKEEDLISLGFNRTDVSKEESGDEAFYYYTYDFGFKYGISLITCDDADGKEHGWCVDRGPCKNAVDQLAAFGQAENLGQRPGRCVGFQPFHRAG